MNAPSPKRTAHHERRRPTSPRSSRPSPRRRKRSRTPHRSPRPLAPIARTPRR